jgi:hypothetical protein
VEVSDELHGVRAAATAKLAKRSQLEVEWESMYDVDVAGDRNAGGDHGDASMNGGNEVWSIDGVPVVPRGGVALGDIAAAKANATRNDVLNGNGGGGGGGGVGKENRGGAAANLNVRAVQQANAARRRMNRGKLAVGSGRQFSAAEHTVRDVVIDINEFDGNNSYGDGNNNIALETAAYATFVVPPGVPAATAVTMGRMAEDIHSLRSALFSTYCNTPCDAFFVPRLSATQFSLEINLQQLHQLSVTYRS